MSESAKKQGIAAQNPTVSAFEAIKHEDGQGEYWLARELSMLLGYERWQNFTGVIQEAMEVCRVQ